MSSPSRPRWLVLAVTVLAADQATKYAVEMWTAKDYFQPVIPGLLNLVHTHNRGVAFGLFADWESPWLGNALVVFSALVMVALAWLLSGDRLHGPWTQAGLALILGGAAGNWLDRLLYGSVIDFIDFYYGQYHWPAFNFADSAIVIGAGLVILELLVPRRHHLPA